MEIAIAVLFGLSAFALVWVFGAQRSEKSILKERTRSLKEPHERKGMVKEKPIELALKIEQRSFWKRSGFYATPKPGSVIVYGIIWVLMSYFVVVKFDLSNLLKILIVITLGLILFKLMRAATERKRVESIRRELPAALDLIVVCLEAGLGIESCFLRVSNEMGDTPLGRELRQTFHEVSAGIPLEEALRSFAKRTRVTEINTICTSLIQAQKMGSALALTFRVQSETIRDKYKMNLREKVAKVPIKVLFPLVFFIFPVLFIVILGPAFIRIMEQLGATAGR